MKWDKERLKSAAIGARAAKYEAIPADEQEEKHKVENPELFSFFAVSVGDEEGQAFFVPLDESDRDTAEYILRAIEAYQGD